MHIQRQADSFAYRMAAEEWDSYDLPSLWEDFQMWYGADDPEQAKEGITYWKNVEDYLSENHGLPSTGDPDSTMRNTLPDEEWENHYYSHPATIGMAKLHSLAQGKNTFDGDPNWSTFDDDDVLQGAALGLLQIRRDRQGRPRTENGYYTTTATRNIQSHNTIRCAADDYRGYHRGPDAEYGASMDNPDMMFPDIDTHPEYYDTNEPYDYESHHQIRRVRGKPDAWVTVYRALPFSVIQNKTYRGGPNDLYEGSKPYRYRQREAPINTNDWVTPSYSYAKEHGEANLSNEPWTIVQQRVPARSLYTEGNSIHEWAYNGEPIVGTEGDRARRERGLRTRNRLSSNTIRCAADDPYSPPPDQDRFSPTPYWFHASPYELAPGTMIVPRGGKTTWNRFYNQLDPHEAREIQNHVWLDNNINISRNRAYGRGHYIYRVEPTTTPQELGLSGGGHSTDSARVIELIEQTPKRTRK